MAPLLQCAAVSLALEIPEGFTSPKGVIEAMDKYCAANPSETICRGAKSIAADLMGKALGEQ